MKKKIQRQPSPQKNLRKPFLEHALELRSRLLWCVLIFLTASLCLAPWYSVILDLLLKPLKQTIYYTSPTGGLSLLIQTCLVGGFLLSLPVFIFHLVRFIQPILPYHSRCFLLNCIVFSTLLMMSGSSLAYFVSLPVSLQFLKGFDAEQVKSLITTTEYFSFITRYIVGFGLFFQLPLVLLIINSISPLSARWLFAKSRYVIVLSLIIAAVLTPTPDVVNMSIMAVPLIGLYYLSIVVIFLVNKQKK